jgi:hypothetical protein
VTALRLLYTASWDSYPHARSIVRSPKSASGRRRPAQYRYVVKIWRLHDGSHRPAQSMWLSAFLQRGMVNPEALRILGRRVSVTVASGRFGVDGNVAS